MEFLRRSTDRYAKLGKGIKKNRKWRKPTGRDNKMRDKRRGYPVVVSVGYIKDSTKRGRINGKKPVMVRNIEDLNRVKNEEIGIVGNIGMKNKIKIAKLAKEKNVEIGNINLNKFLKKINMENKK